MHGGVKWVRPVVSASGTVLWVWPSGDTTSSWRAVNILHEGYIRRYEMTTVFYSLVER